MAILEHEVLKPKAQGRNQRMGERKDGEGKNLDFH